MRRTQLNSFSDASTSVGNIAWRGNVDGNPSLREVVEPFPGPPANCTMRQFRQTLPAVPQPPNGHQLIFHSLSGCWLDPAQACCPSHIALRFRVRLDPARRHALRCLKTAVWLLSCRQASRAACCKALLLCSSLHRQAARGAFDNSVCNIAFV